MRILIVEDNEKLAESLRDILGRQRYETDVCLDGAEGYEMVMSGLYDGVILDVMLPGMDGMSLLAKARRLGCRTPVLMLTAKSATEDKVAGLESGADYYLTKPFDKDELTAALKAVLRRGGDLIPDVLTFGDIRLNQSTYCLERGEKTIRLGKREFEADPHGPQGGGGLQGDPDFKNMGKRRGGGGQQRGNLRVLPAKETGLFEGGNGDCHGQEPGLLSDKEVRS